MKCLSLAYLILIIIVMMFFSALAPSVIQPVGSVIASAAVLYYVAGFFIECK